MGPVVVKEKIDQGVLKKLLDEYFETMVKVAVDVEQGVIAVGGEWHSLGEELLARDEGSRGQDVWGANVYPSERGDRRIEYISLINIKPSLGNRNMVIGDGDIRDKVKGVVEMFLLDGNETFTA